MAIETPLERASSTAPSPAPYVGKRVAKSKSSVFKVILLIGTVTLVFFVAVVIRAAISSSDDGPKLTHTISRGDLIVSVITKGLLESSENNEIKCKVRGRNTVTWVIESGSYVEPGDVLVKLDPLAMQEAIDERSKYANWSQSAADHSQARVTRSTLAVSEYELGRYEAELAALHRDLAIAEGTLRSEKNWHRHTKMLHDRGFATDFDVQERFFSVRQAELDVEVKKTQLEVHGDYAKLETMEMLNGNLAATAATHEANAERAIADASRRDRALEEMEHCVIEAERSGLVIYPSASEWLTGPDIVEGATVHMHQVLLLMPDLSKMQVKLGLHESFIEKIVPTMPAKVKLVDRTIDAEVSSVASVARPAGIWTGNEVKYDTIIKLPDVGGLKPGMSAEVEIVLARYTDVLTIPVAAVVEDEEHNFCWVKTDTGIQRRLLKLGDSNEIFTIVEGGLQEGDIVMLDPTPYAGKSKSESGDRESGDSESRDRADDNKGMEQNTPVAEGTAKPATQNSTSSESYEKP